jgi:hypothetical protein
MSDNLLTAGTLTVSNGISAMSLNVNTITCSSIECEELNQLSVQNMQSLDTISSLTDQFSEVDSRLAEHDVAISAIEAKNTEQDGRLTTSEGNITTINTTLLAHQAVNDTQNTRLTSAEGRLTTNEGNIASHSTSISSINSSISTINTKNNQQDSSISSLSSHQSSQDSSISSNSDSIYNLNVKATMMTYDSNCTTISRSGTNSTASFRVASDGGEQVLFVPKAVNNSFNKLIDQNDSAIVGASTVAIVPWNTNNNNGIRITQNDTTIAATTSDSVDNYIKFNADAKTIEFLSPNWITSNRAFVCPDVILSGTSESISGDISLLRAADTTETNNRTAADTTLTNNLNTEIQNRIDGDAVLTGQYSSLFNGLSTHTDLIGALQTKTAYLSTSSSESHFSSNVVLDNLSSVYINRTSNYTTPLLYCNTAPLFMVKAMVSFFMSASGVQLMNGGSKSVGYSITRNSTGVYFLTLPTSTLQTITSFSTGSSVFLSCSAQIKKCAIESVKWMDSKDFRGFWKQCNRDFCIFRWKLAWAVGFAGFSKRATSLYYCVLLLNSRFFFFLYSICPLPNCIITNSIQPYST